MTPWSHPKSSLARSEESQHTIYSLSVAKAGSNMNKLLVGCSGWKSRVYETDLKSSVYAASRVPLGLSSFVFLVSLVISFFRRWL